MADQETQISTADMDEQPSTGAQDPQADALKQLLNNSLRDLIKEHVTADVDREKIFQYAEARKNELYWRANQYVYPILTGGITADWSSNSGTIGYNSDVNEREATYDYVMNVIRGDGRKFIAVLGQRGPNAKAQPRRPDDEAAIRRARKADVAAAYLRSVWDVERVQANLAMSLWKNGTTFAYTPWVSDASLYGVVDEPIIDTVQVPMGAPEYHCIICGGVTPGDTQPTPAPQAPGAPPAPPSVHCQQCNAPLKPENLDQPPVVHVPKIVGSKQYPKGTVELHLATIFEVTVPFYVRDLRETPWLWYEYEEHRAKLITAFPQLKKKFEGDDWGGDGDNTGISSQGRLARDVASSPTGTFVSPRKNRWLYSRFWLRPAMYNLLRDDGVAQKLAQLYPEGVKVTLVQGEVVEVVPERLEDVWSYCKSDTSEYIFSDPVCKDYMGIQDLINDLHNIVTETLERAIPYMLADPQVLDVQQLSKQRGKPAQIIPAKAGVGARLTDSIVKAPTASVDADIYKWMELVHQKGREITGVLPAIFGGDAPSQTAREAELRRNQALQQLNTIWNEMRRFWAQVYSNACKQLAKYAASDGRNVGMMESDQDFTDLVGGGYYFETDEAIPMTWGQKRDLIMFMLQGGPESWKVFGLEHPANIPKVHEALGLQGWKIPQLDARDKVMHTIKLLLQEQPQQPTPPPPPPPGMPPPPPPPPQPSIPISTFEDDPMFVASVIKEWCQSEEGRTEKELNPQGYANVIAYGQASLTAGMPPPPPPGAGSPALPGGKPTNSPSGPHVPITPQNMPGAPQGVAAPPPPGSQVGAPFIPGPTTPPVGPPPPA